MSRLVRLPQRANENSAIAGLEDVLGPGNLAAILLATFTVVSGLIAPCARKPKKSVAKAPARPERRQLDLVEPSPA